MGCHCGSSGLSMPPRREYAGEGRGMGRRSAIGPQPTWQSGFMLLPVIGVRAGRPRCSVAHTVECR